MDLSIQYLLIIFQECENNYYKLSPLYKWFVTGSHFFIILPAYVMVHQKPNIISNILIFN